MITVVITSFNRFDLLYKTVDSFKRMNTCPVKEIIIIEDSGDKSMHNKIKKAFPDCRFILNEHNIGLVESIDKAYEQVTTPFIFHTEDDFDYFRPFFIERCIKVMEYDEKVFRVGIRGESHIKMLAPNVLMADEVTYRLPLDIPNHPWHGFGFQCGLIRKSAYDLVKPYTQYNLPDAQGRPPFITAKECQIGLAYYGLGLKAVSLTEDYVKHTGGRRSTYGLRMEG